MQLKKEDEDLSTALEALNPESKPESKPKPKPKPKPTPPPSLSLSLSVKLYLTLSKPLLWRPSSWS